MIIIRSKPVSCLTRSEYDQCRKLTLSGISMMRDQLQYDRESSNNSRAIFLLDQDRKKIIAWALLHTHKSWRGTEQRVMYFYVHKDHRRRGYGSRLYRHARRFENEIFVCPCNEINRAFFRSIKAANASGWR